MEPYLLMSLLQVSNSFALKKTKLECKPQHHQLITSICSRRFIDQSCAHINIGIDLDQPFWTLKEITLHLPKGEIPGTLYPYYCFMPSTRIPLLFPITYALFTLTDDLNFINLVAGFVGFSSAFPCPCYRSRANT